VPARFGVALELPLSTAALHAAFQARHFNNLLLGGCHVRFQSSFVRGYTAVLLVASLLAIPVAAQSRETAARSNAVDVSTIRIDNFGRVNSNYYRGAQPAGRDYANLASLGIKTLINLTSDDADASEKTMAEHAGMRYVQIPMTTHQPPTSSQLSQFLAIVNDPANQPVYVHCVGGRHRTGVMTAVYRMTQEGWNADQAFEEMKQYKFGADFLHPEFKEFVYGYRAIPAHAAPASTVAATKTGG
jgi:tyrosine-protein phosphatase SIW14